MVIVIVRWYIKRELEPRFKETWIGMVPKFKDGLFREFYSKPVNTTEEKYHTLDIESRNFTTYINVGIWRELQDFENAIGSMIPIRNAHPTKDGKELIEVFDFEFKLRERIVMNVEETRGGDWELPVPTI